MFEEIACEIKSVKHGNMTLLGLPVLPSAVDTGMALESKLGALSRLVLQLDQVDVHEALFLLRNCFAIPILTCVLMTSACFQSPLLKSFDSKICCALEKVLNIQLSGLSWEQCTLPSTCLVWRIEYSFCRRHSPSCIPIFNTRVCCKHAR